MSDYAKLTVVQLKAECAKLKLDATGRKADLVERLTAAAGSSAPTAAAEPAASGRPKRGAKKVAAAEPEEEEEEVEAPKAKRGGSKRKAAAVAPAAAEEEEEEAVVAPKAKRGKKAAAVAPVADEEEEEEAAPATPKKGKAAAAKAAPAATTAKKCVYKVDPACRLFGATVHEDYDVRKELDKHARVVQFFPAMLNQTNIGANNNKFYRIQVLECGGAFFCWTHWGRVGEDGQHANQAFGSNVAGAISAFEKKFKDKTSNKWEDRANFSAKSGKYMLLEMDNSGDEDEEARLAERLNAYNSAVGSSAAAAPGSPAAGAQFRPSELDPAVQELMALCFDTGMFQQTMKTFEIDTAKMPLGKLSKSQIAKGFDILTEIESAIKNHSGGSKLNALSSQFYTQIPHDFGRRTPPQIGSLEQLKQKQDLLNVLADIEVAQTMQAEAKKKAAAEAAAAEAVDVSTLPRHPLDDKYDTLACDLAPLPRNHPEFKIIEKYVEATRSGRPAKVAIEQIFTVNRHGEDKRFAAHDHITNRRLCWHGTSVAVVAAILNSGLRIMPHSGGRVGKGIYLADQHGKSSDYVCPAQFRGSNTAIMFLAEAALGAEHAITRDDHTLRAPPKGFDSIVARGYTGPDPKKDAVIRIDGKDVAVPQSPPVGQGAYAGSSFDKSEFLLYQESQHRLRYCIKFSWNY